MSQQVALFVSVDVNGDEGLWITDGTSVGAQEIADGADGVFPAGGFGSEMGPQITAFDNGALFVGPSDQLWATDGTTAGTFELQTLRGPQSHSFGYDVVSPDFTVLDGEALFSGYDANGYQALWETDGTAAGTHEILVGTSAAFMTVFNGQVLFDGSDGGLWASDGTQAGTHVLVAALAPLDLTALGNEVVFVGMVGNNANGLWVTDGTSAGTHEVSTAPSFFDVGALAPDLTAYNGQALFRSYDASGDLGLWVTDGTGAGTHELTGIAGAWSGGICLDGDPDITVAGGKAFFIGYDSSQQIGLWVTDGTAAGTHEITGIAGAWASGITPSNLVAFNNQLLFDGVDASGAQALWATDGTAAGTQELALGEPASVAVVNGQALFFGAGLEVTDGTAAGTHAVAVVGVTGSGPGDLTAATLDVTLPPPPPLPLGDYTGAGRADLLLLNSNDTLAQWDMNGAAVVGGGDIDGMSPNLSAGWAVAGVADFNGDGKADLLLQDGATLAQWQMNGAQVIGGGDIGNLSAGWGVVATGDFNGDGKADILLQNGATLAEWLMNGTQVIGGGAIGGVSPNLSAGWSVAGIGDFNGDGKSDLLLQSVDGNGATTVAEWLMNGTAVIGGGVIGTLLDGWGVAGIGDFNGDGKSDILLQHSTGGVADALAEWQMNGTQVTGGGYLNGVDPNLSTGWSVGGVGDFNGDGKADILLQGSHGQIAEWLINGTTVIGGGVIGTVASPWSVL